MDEAQTTVPNLAARLGADPKTMRAWMRRQDWRHPVENGSPWVLTGEQIEVLSGRFGASSSGSASAELEREQYERPLASQSVGDLLSSYRNILRELRVRGLVRTNNAPIGDLAEYCAAIVYDGLLAPNSEKSYDLAAADGRRIQVKVRLLRPGTSPSAVFSPIRSFDFDACAFILIDDSQGRVAGAREWTAEEVTVHGRHRAHTNGTVVRVGQLRATNGVGKELTEAFDEAWHEILEQRGTPEPEAH